MRPRIEIVSWLATCSTVSTELLLHSCIVFFLNTPSERKALVTVEWLVDLRVHDHTEPLTHASTYWLFNPVSPTSDQH